MQSVTKHRFARLSVATWLALGTATVACAADTPIGVIKADASASDTNLPSYAVDGSLASRWSGEGDGVWLRLKFDRSHPVGSVAIAWYQGDQRRNTFDVQTSPDGSAWTNVYSGTSSGNTEQAQTYPLTQTNAAYLRVVGHGNTVNDWTSISEIAAYEHGAGAPGDCGAPSDVLDLSDWKETLPVDDPNKSGTQPLEVSQPKLDGYQLDPWFVARSGCDGVQFRAAVNGVTTSGSSNPRSELREMDGDDEASWSSTSGTHTMVIQEAITHLPAERKAVVAGQIHDADDDVSVFRLEGSKLYVTNGDTSHYQLVTSNYVLGTPFEAKFVVANGQIKAYYNGSLVATISKNFSDAYFKAGAYTQANCSDDSPCSASNYGEVVIYDVAVSHQ